MLIFWPDLLISASFLRKARSEEDITMYYPIRRRLDLFIHDNDTGSDPTKADKVRCADGAHNMPNSNRG